MSKAIRELSMDEIEQVVGGNQTCKEVCYPVTVVTCDRNGKNCTAWHGLECQTICNG